MRRARLTVAGQLPNDFGVGHVRHDRETDAALGTPVAEHRVPSLTGDPSARAKKKKAASSTADSANQTQFFGLTIEMDSKLRSILHDGLRLLVG